MPVSNYNDYLKNKDFHILLSLFDKWIEGDLKGESGEPNIFGFYDLIAERDGLHITVTIGMLEHSLRIKVERGESQLFYLLWFNCHYIDIINIKNKVIEFGLTDWDKPLMRCVLSLTGSPILKVDTQYNTSSRTNFIEVRKT